MTREEAIGFNKNLREYMRITDKKSKYKYGYILLPNGECVEGKVDSWSDYDESEQIQVVIDGITYFTDTTRCVLVKYGEADK